MKKSTWFIVVPLVIILLLFGGSSFRTYNDMTTMEERIGDNWIRIDSAMQSRNDLIPNLVYTVRGYAPRERRVFDRVARARVGLAEAKDIDELVEANKVMESALDELLAVVDTHPPLKDDRNFNRLRDEMAVVEKRITVECREYNGSIRDYNAFLEPFPNNIIAGIFGFVRSDARFDTPDEEANLLVLDEGGEE